MRHDKWILAFAILLLLACWLLAGYMWGASGPGWLIPLALAAWLFVPALRRAAWRFSAGAWLAIGLVSLAGLALPIVSMEAVFPAGLPDWLMPALYLLPSVIQAFALIVAARLLYLGLTPITERRNSGAAEGGEPPVQRSLSGWAAGAALVLSARLVAKSLYNLYWVTVWEMTIDPVPGIWVAMPALAVVLAGGLLFVTLPGWAKTAGLLYLLLILASIARVSSLAQGVDFRQLTAERAEQVSQAIEAYHAREGRYPASLQRLIPRDALSLPGPVVIYGQDWCYRGGDNFYELGYVTRDHWSSPVFTGQVYMSQGVAGDSGGVCEQEIAAIHEANPEYAWASGR